KTYVGEVVELMRERITFASDIAAAEYFFHDPEAYDPKGLSKRWKEDTPALLTEYAGKLREDEVFDAESAEQSLRALAEARGVGAGRIIHPTRLALSGLTFGPGLFELMSLLGRETCVRRIMAAVDRLD
ncbi:MAG: glutamate--tRNA ligase, partial [Rhodothermales bacterium]|nr:glutamate--tRNA ligase [Rhodothermales bacterium]